MNSIRGQVMLDTFSETFLRIDVHYTSVEYIDSANRCILPFLVQNKLFSKK